MPRDVKIVVLWKKICVYYRTNSLYLIIITNMYALINRTKDIANQIHCSLKILLKLSFTVKPEVDDNILLRHPIGGA